MSWFDPDFENFESIARAQWRRQVAAHIVLFGGLLVAATAFAAAL